MQFESFKDANHNANQYKKAWVRNHCDESTEPAYVGYLQIMVAFLESLQTHEPVTRITPAPKTTPESLPKVFLQVVWRLPAPFRYLILSIAGAIGVLFLVWSSLPESAKQSALELLWKLFR